MSGPLRQLAAVVIRVIDVLHEGLRYRRLQREDKTRGPDVGTDILPSDASIENRVARIEAGPTSACDAGTEVFRLAADCANFRWRFEGGLPVSRSRDSAASWMRSTGAMSHGEYSSVDFRVALRLVVRVCVQSMLRDQTSDGFRGLWMTAFARYDDVGVADALTDGAPAATVAERCFAVRAIRLVMRPLLTASQTSSTARADRGRGVHDGIAVWTIDQILNLDRHSGPITCWRWFCSRSVG